MIPAGLTMTFTPETARAWVDVDLARAGGQRAHARRASPAAGCCRWSKLTATVSAPSRSRARSSRSIRGASASRRSRKARRSGPRGSRGRSWWSSPLLPDAIDALSRARSPSHRSAIRRRSTPGCARDRPAVSPRDRHRDEPGGRPLGRRAGARRPRGAARDGDRLGRASSPTFTARIPIRRPRRCSGIGSRPSGDAARAGRRWCMPPTARPRSRAAPTPAT